MLFSTKNLITTSLVLLLSAPAFAGSSLSSLLGGESLVSNNGKLVFSEFKFTPGNNAPSSTDIEIMTLDSGLLFGSPIFTDSATGIIDFGVAYKATAVGTQIVSAAMASNGTATGDGVAAAYKLVKNSNGDSLAELTNTISAGNSSSSDSALFAALGGVDVNDSFSFSGGTDGAAGLIQLQQTFGTENADETIVPERLPTTIPSPTAALAGLALLGLAGMRRRRA